MYKHSILALGAMLTLGACGNQRPADQFNLKGSIDGADGQTIFLTYQTNDSIARDSVIIKDGSFEFNGNIGTPSSAALYTGDGSWGSKTSLNLYLEPTDMTVTGLKGDDYSEAVVSGSKTQTEMENYNAVINPIFSQLQSVRTEMQSAGEDIEKAKAAQVRFDSLANLYNTATIDFIKNNPGSYYSADLLNRQTSQSSYEELKNLFEILTPEVQAHAKEAAKEIAALENVMPGKPAPDLIGVDPEGRDIKLSDLKGKVVLVDFWATWCKPCRAALPHIAELFGKYHDKGFEVFCVADNDSDPDNWKAVIIEEGMQGYHNILRGMKIVRDANGRFLDFDRSNDQSDKYAVHSLPTKYLIAADGTIIGKIDSNEDLDAKLAEIFSE